jgi:glyoxylase-like metal-dependent hydrolase (beta-lactamase superfamily II)
MILFNRKSLSKVFTGLALCLALSACAMQKPAELRLYVLDCGYMDMQDWPQFQPLYGVPESAVAIPAQANPCFLIINGGKSLLWDAGLPDATPREPTLTEFGVKFSMPNKLNTQMESLGVPPGDLDYFAISHLHFDHVGNWPYFKNVNTLLQRAELTAATRPGQNGIGYDAAIIEAISDYEKLTLLDGDYDVFGDGLVTLVITAGHTEGHQALVVKLADYGPVIISGDAIHFAEELEHHILPTFNDSAEQSEEAVKRLLELEATLNGELWIQHDPVQHQQRKMAPEFYR